jgi:hypothetical protein
LLERGHSIFSAINEYGEPCLSDVDIESDEDDASKGKHGISGLCLWLSIRVLPHAMTMRATRTSGGAWADQCVWGG